jgi:AbrB family looped-hinge helix DNA binding protein
MGYTITEKGTVTVPAEVRRKLGLGKGSQVDFVETDQGVLIVPIVPFENLRGVDKNKRKIVHQMIREIQRERALEAIEK